MHSDAAKLDLFSGIGLCAAAMIGSGVFVSAGFMAQDLPPELILLAWLVGAVFAMCGARAYAEVARLVPRSGGEYRYLSTLMHPALGYVAGWVSLILGFAAPLAVNALAAAAFIDAVLPTGQSRAIGIGLVLILSLSHAISFHTSRLTQNLLFAVKMVLLVGFVGLGLALGESDWPTWSPPNTDGDASLWAPFAGSLLYISYAFSGWNTSAYAAEEFRRPERDVPRAMIIACALVGVLYLTLNWVFVANLSPADAAVAMDYDQHRVTLGHALMEKLVGTHGAAVMAILAVITFVSAMSAMVMVGPRISANMAMDGFLPRALIPAPGAPPTLAVAVQAAMAIALMLAHSLRDVLTAVGAILVLFTALTAASLFWARRRLPEARPPSPASLVAAALYVLASGWMLYFGFRDHAVLLLWLAGVAAIALIAYAASRRLRGARA